MANIKEGDFGGLGEAIEDGAKEASGYPPEGLPNLYRFLLGAAAVAALMASPTVLVFVPSN
jgi:hypothetical protein